MQTIDVNKLAAESGFNRFHGIILFWGILILVLDGYDLAIVGAALPSIMAEMGIDATQAGFMASSALFGMMLGAMSFGLLADRFGRPMMLSACIALFSLFTAAAGLAKDPVTFSILRFLAGLGIGGVLPIVTAQMAEFAPAKLRARLVTLVFAGYSIGGVLVALIGKTLIESWGWPSVFFTAGLPILLIPALLKTMPESMSFLVRQGRTDELRRIAAKLAPDLVMSKDVLFTAPISAAEATPLRGLFQDGRGFSTVMIWTAFFMGLFMVYALSAWLTKLMAMAGYSLGSALNFVIVFNLGAMIGAVFGGWLGDRFNIKHVLLSFYFVGAASLILMGFTKSTSLLFFVVFVVGASTLGTQLLAYAYAGSFYPTAMRATGVGFASGVGRSGAILAPIVIGILVGLNLPLEQNFIAIAGAGLLGTIAVALIDHSKSTIAQEAENRSNTAAGGGILKSRAS
jgi:AAHS family benzoate transporter-like MFS transporter